jgi:hypothetical protein
MTGLLLFRKAPTKYPQHTHFVLHLEGGGRIRDSILEPSSVRTTLIVRPGWIGSIHLSSIRA